MRMTTQRTGALRSVQSETASARATAGMGTAIEGIADSFQKAQDYSDTLENKNRADIRFREIREAYAMDRDPKNKEMYQKQIQDVKDSIGEFSNNLARLEFDQYLQSQINREEIILDNAFFKKNVDWTVANIDTQGQVNINKHIQGDPNAYATQKNVVATAWNGGKGYLTPQMYQQKQPNISKWDYAKAVYDLQNVPSQLKTEAERDAYRAEVEKRVSSGEYNMNPEDRSRFEKDARGIRKKSEEEIKRQAEIISTETVGGLAEHMANGTLTQDMIQEKMDKNLITDKEAEPFMTSFTTTKTPSEDADNTEMYYTELLSKVADDKGKAKGVILMASRAYNAGVLDQDEYTFFLADAQGMLKDQAEQRLNQKAEKMKVIERNLKGLSMLSKVFPYKFFFKQMAGGMDEQKALKETQKATVVKVDPTLYTSEDPVTDYYNKQAVRVLQDNGKPVTKANIDYIANQMQALENMPVEE